jgi:hypothetical protein
MFHMTEQDREMIEQNVDTYGDSYCQDVTVDDLRNVRSSSILHHSNDINFKQIFNEMPKSEHLIPHQQLLAQFRDHNPDLGDTLGWMFYDLVVYFDKPEKTIDQLDSDATIEKGYAYDLETKLAGQIVYFTGGKLADNFDDEKITHVVVDRDKGLKEIRMRISL